MNLSAKVMQLHVTARIDNSLYNNSCLWKFSLIYFPMLGPLHADCPQQTKNNGNIKKFYANYCRILLPFKLS